MIPIYDCVEVVTGTVQMLGDSMFNYPIDRMVKLHGNKVCNIKLQAVLPIRIRSEPDLKLAGFKQKEVGSKSD